jgi:hypothetical protein
LSVGGNYQFDLFYTERHTTASDLKFTTSLLVQCPWYALYDSADFVGMTGAVFAKEMDNTVVTVLPSTFATLLPVMFLMELAYTLLWHVLNLKTNANTPSVFSRVT